MTSEPAAIDGALPNHAADRPAPPVAADGRGAVLPSALRARLRSLALRALVVVIAAAVLAGASYQAGRMDLFGSITGADAVPRVVQIGSDTPGQPFGLLVDNISTLVTVPVGVRVPNNSCAAVHTSETFESGALPASATIRTAGDGVAKVVQGPAGNPTHVAQLSSTTTRGSYAYYRLDLCQGTAMDVTADFLVSAEGQTVGNVPLFRLFNTDGTRLLSLYRQNGTGDRIFVQVRDRYQRTTARMPLQTWASMSLHVSYPNHRVRVIQLVMNDDLVYDWNG